MRYAVLDEQHRLVPTDDIHEWGRFFDDRDRRTVGFDDVDGVRVSTVFLGLDHGYLGEHLWFETMIFEDKDRGWDQDMDRYETWEEAETGHRAVVARLRAGLSPWEEETDGP